MVRIRSPSISIDTSDVGPRKVGLELHLWTRTVIWVIAKHLPSRNGRVSKRAASLWYTIRANCSSALVLSIRLWNESTSRHKIAPNLGPDLCKSTSQGWVRQRNVSVSELGRPKVTRRDSQRHGHQQHHIIGKEISR
jgi:hypothetical protein